MSRDEVLISSDKRYMADFFEAQNLRESHCADRGRDHECVGVVTIKKDVVCLDCPLCGSGVIHGEVVRR